MANKLAHLTKLSRLLPSFNPHLSTCRTLPCHDWCCDLPQSYCLCHCRYLGAFLFVLWYVLWYHIIVLLNLDVLLLHDILVLVLVLIFVDIAVLLNLVVIVLIVLMNLHPPQSCCPW